MKKMHLVIRGERKGPFTLEEIQRQLDSGEVGLFDVVETDGRRVTLQEILPEQTRPSLPESRQVPPFLPPPPLPEAGKTPEWSRPPPPPPQAQPPAAKSVFCRFCAQPVMASSVICPQCGSPTGSSGQFPSMPRPTASLPHPTWEVSKSRMAYILLGLFLGYFGVHNFYAGYTGKGVAQLLLCLFSPVLLFIPLLVLFVWTLVEICTVTQDAQGIRFH